MEQLREYNETLAKVSALLFGDAAEIRVVNPRELSLLKQNARFFKKEVFRQLVDNVRKDKRLSSTPLCHLLEGGALEVLSGNHRVQAAIEAGVEYILVIVILQDLNRSERISIQLSHNSLVGQDDRQILADLWSQIEEIEQKCYAGLSSDLIGELKDVKLVSFTTPALRTRFFTFAFTESEAEHYQQILDELDKLTGDCIFLAPMEQFDRFFEMVQEVKKKEKIKNGSLAMARVLDIVGGYLQAAEGHG